MRHLPLVFIRHGETDWNRDLRFQGQQDIPLNAIGRRQAARNGRAVARILGEQEWRLIASPLERSVETMRIVLAAARQPDRQFETSPALMEVHYGDWEGLTLTEISERHPEAVKARDADKWGYAPPNGESYSMLSERIAAWLPSISAPALLVAHGGVLRALMHQLGGLPPHDAPHLASPQDRVILFTQRSILTI